MVPLSALRRAPSVALAWALAAVPGSAGAQVAVAEASLTTLSVGSGSLTELVFPVAAGWAFGPVRVDLNTAWARARYTQQGVESTLSGLTDVTVRLMVPLLDDRARVAISANLPTGTETLTEAELPVAAAITTDLLGLPVRSFGSGAGVTAGVALARPAGSWVVGGIAAYRVGAAYEPVAGSGGLPAAEFRPGSELRVRLAAERPAVGGVAWRLAAGWSHFGSDRAGEEDVFLRGDRIMAEAAAELPVGSGAATLYAWNLYRSESEIRFGTAAEPAPASNLAGVGGELAWPVGETLTLRPRLDLLVQTGEPGFGGGEGWITRIGSSLSWRFDAFRFEPALYAQAGSLDGTRIVGAVVRAGVLWER